MFTAIDKLSSLKHSWLLIVSALVLTPSLSGCAASRCVPGMAQLDSELQSRVHRGLGTTSCNAESVIPEDIVLTDGLTADEAVGIALWNNSAFNGTLARLGMARGDLVQAGLLKNPQFVLLLPGGTKQLEWALFLPVDALLLRETRLDMTERDVCRVAQELVQNGLNLVRDVRVSHADLVFAIDRAALADEAVQLRRDISELTDKQLQAGDISELQATTARIDFLRAQADAAGLAHAVAQADARLKQLMSLGTLPQPLNPIATDDGLSSHHDLDSLIAEAMVSRPDLRAASFALEAAQHRAELSRWQWLKFDLVADANSGGAGPSNIGPGFRFDIPFFDRNEGGIQSADWSVYQASQNYYAVRDQIVMEVQTAYSQVQQAQDSLTILQTDVLSALHEAVDLAGKAYAGGGAPYFLVLQTTTQFLDARTTELQLTADLRRAAAELDRSVGRQLERQPVPIMLPPVDDELGATSPVPWELDRVTADAKPDPEIPGIADGASLLNADIHDEPLGSALRRIADRVDVMEADAKQSSQDNKKTPLRIGGALTAGWR